MKIFALLAGFSGSPEEPVFQINGLLVALAPIPVTYAKFGLLREP